MLLAPCFTAGRRFWSWCVAPFTLFSSKHSIVDFCQVYLMSCIHRTFSIEVLSNIQVGSFGKLEMCNTFFFPTWTKSCTVCRVLCRSLAVTLVFFFTSCMIACCAVGVLFAGRPLLGSEFPPFVEKLSCCGLMNTHVLRNACVAFSSFVYLACLQSYC